jgi:hypothetical protein
MAGLLVLASFVVLFDGKTLDGWKQCNGTANYAVSAGEIVGTTSEGSPNSFLCSEREYGDFVLEFETKTDPALNSGVQIRSHQYKSGATVRTFNGKQIVERKHEAGRVHGYQVEVATEKSGASGGIYDEARRGWVHNTSSDPACKVAFKDNQWNKYRVEAHGDRIRTWVNGVPCADLIDSMDLTGFIALQVHSYKGDKPAQVRWRNIRIEDNGRHEWKPLFNSTSLDGWKHSGGGSFKVEDGAIHAASVGRSGMLISDASFRDVTARVRFRIAKGSGGLFVRTDPKTLVGYEAAIDAAKAGSGIMDNEWNDLTASLQGSRMVVTLNGVKTVDRSNNEKASNEGRLGLQVDGSETPADIWFKSVEVLKKAR